MPDIHIVITPNPAREQIGALATELLNRRQSILQAWRQSGEGTDEESIAPTLSRTQFNDHIPNVLDRFADTLRSWPDVQGLLAEEIEAESVGQHGMQRWQQGYQLCELISEWGNLQTVVADELEHYASAHADLDPLVMPTVRRMWTQLCAKSVTQSVTQYGKLEEKESAGRVHDLLNLARLEAGHEKRELTTFDAAVLLREFCTSSQRLATDRGLFLEMDGPNELMIEGDKIKIQRILQNLLLNAIKYTPHGGVSVTWCTDDSRYTDRWTFSVKDTGPGIDNNHKAPMAHELHEATKAGDDIRADSGHPSDDGAPATTLPSGSRELPTNEQAGEGVGLIIVKRLCELLDAGLELATTPGQGTTFRVILPKSYKKV